VGVRDFSFLGVPDQHLSLDRRVSSAAPAFKYEGLRALLLRLLNT